MDENIQETQESEEQYNPTEEEIVNLNDEEFEKYISTNVFPENKRIRHETSQNTEDVDDNSVDNASENRREANEKTSNDNTVSDKEEKSGSSSEEIPNYEEVYKKIFTPFKANGREISPKNAEDVISLMQMGANYTKKMQALAPVRKSALLLDQEGIDNNRLSFLIDLHKGNKNAIKKLLKDNNLDVTDLDIDEENTYQPTKYNVSDTDLAFQDTLIDAKENLPQISQIINSWDSASRSAALNDPNIIKGLEWEITNGRYEKASKIVEQERMFGRLQGLNDLQAYIEIATRLQNQEQQQNVSKQSNKPKSTPTAGDKRKAAPSKGKSSPTKSTLTPKDLFDMPEEEFLKLSEKDLV